MIGGGWAGLAAAVELCAAGVTVSVFESARQLGGRARSVVIDGRTLDNGQHILLGAYRETLRLMRQVGAEPERYLRRQTLELRQDREAFRLRLPRLPSPWHLACGLALARGLPLREKFGAIRFMRALQADAYQLPADTSVAAWLDHHEQRGVLRRLMWEPLCFAALNTAPENASAQVFANVLRDSLGRHPQPRRIERHRHQRAVRPAPGCRAGSPGALPPPGGGSRSRRGCGQRTGRSPPQRSA